MMYPLSFQFSSSGGSITHQAFLREYGFFWQTDTQLGDSSFFACAFSLSLTVAGLFPSPGIGFSLNLLGCLFWYLSACHSLSCYISTLASVSLLPPSVFGSFSLCRLLVLKVLSLFSLFPLSASIDLYWYFCSASQKAAAFSTMELPN